MSSKASNPPSARIRKSARWRVAKVSELPPLLWGAMGLLALLAAIGPNPGIGLLGAVVAIVASLLLWRPGEPQILLFIVGYNWIQAFTPVLQGIIQGEPISAVMGGAEFESATVLTLLGIVALALGLKSTTRPASAFAQASILGGLKRINFRRLVLGWAGLSVANIGLGIIGASVPALLQALIAFEIWKWAAVFLIFFRWLATGRGGTIAVVVLVSEVGVGMMSYFSGFKEVFFVLLLAGSGALAMGKKPSGILVGTCVFLVVLLGFWQAIKGGYRTHMSRGEEAQVVQVSVRERFDYLSDAVNHMDLASMADGLESGLDRLGYVKFFGHAIRSVPVLIPHTNGLLWKEAVMHPLMPRFLFPDKPAINDSDRTNAYTGVQVAGADKGTSVSIGYMGESYIDFGVWGMFPAIFLWGSFVGWLHQILRRMAPHPVLGVAVSSCLLLSTVLLLEASNIKMTGSLIAGFLVSAALMYFFGKSVWRWLTYSSKSPSSRSRRNKRRVARPYSVTSRQQESEVDLVQKQGIS